LKGGSITKSKRTEQHIIKKSHPLWQLIDDNCFYSKNLYNYANYFIRQEFFNTGQWLRFYNLDKQLHQSEPYKQLMSQPSQCTLAVLDRAWKSFFVTIKDWKKHPEKYRGMPRPPKYKDKNGRFTWFIKNNQSRIKDGFLEFGLKKFKGYKFRTKAKGRLISVRFVPHSNYYVLEIITEVEVPDIPDKIPERIVSIDLGVNNLVTLTNNIGLQPIVINGKGVKSINQFYNKRKATMQSDLMKRNKKHWGKKLDQLSFKRNMRIKNFIHNVSRKVVNYCIMYSVDALVCGYNAGWKQDCKMNKVNTQTFSFLPYSMLIQQLNYKCENEGIRFIQTEESYTSGTSFLDDELPIKENYNKSRRIKRGLFKSNEGVLINSDVNGSYQIMKKVFPDAFAEGIEGVGLHPLVINVVKTA
jgi:putative transposase